MTESQAMFTYAEMSIESGRCPLAVGMIPAAPPGLHLLLSAVKE